MARRTVTQNDVDEARALLTLMEAEHAENLRKPKFVEPESKAVVVPERKPNTKTETPVNRFKRICGGRAGLVKRGIETIASCSGQGYEYTEQQVDKIETQLQNTLDNTIAVLRAGLNPKPKANKTKIANPNFMEL